MLRLLYWLLIGPSWTKPCKHLWATKREGNIVQHHCTGKCKGADVGECCCTGDELREGVIGYYYILKCDNCGDYMKRKLI